MYASLRAGPLGNFRSSSAGSRSSRFIGYYQRAVQRSLLYPWTEMLCYRWRRLQRLTTLSTLADYRHIGSRKIKLMTFLLEIPQDTHVNLRINLISESFNFHFGLSRGASGKASRYRLIYIWFITGLCLTTYVTFLPVGSLQHGQAPLLSCHGSYRWLVLSYRECLSVTMWTPIVKRSVMYMTLMIPHTYEMNEHDQR